MFTFFKRKLAKPENYEANMRCYVNTIARQINALTELKNKMEQDIEAHTKSREQPNAPAEAELTNITYKEAAEFIGE